MIEKNMVRNIGLSKSIADYPFSMKPISDSKYNLMCSVTNKVGFIGGTYDSK